jgi:hypothetical protein
MAAKSPLALVKEKFGDKEKLVEALEKLTSDDLWVARTNKDKGLAHVSNSKLLRLHRLFTEVKEKFGTRDKLIDALLGLDNRPKDQGLRQKYAAWPVPRLYDAYRSTEKRLARAKAAADGKGEGAAAKGAPEKAEKATKKAPAAAKAPAKKGEAKPAAAKAAAAPKAEEKKPAATKEPKATKAKAKTK